MLRYQDTGSGRADVCPGAWFDRHLVDGIQSFRGQFGFSRYKALRKYAAVIQGLIRNRRVVNLVLGSNSTDPLTVQDLRNTFGLVQGDEHSHLTVVTYSNAIFHPKVAHVVDAGGVGHAIVGSANLTEQAFGKHVEAWVEIDQGHELTNGPLSDIIAAIDRWHTLREAGVYQILALTDIDALLARGLIVDEATRRARRAAARDAGGGGGGAGGRGTRPTRWHAPDAEDDETLDEELEGEDVEPVEPEEDDVDEGGDGGAGDAGPTPAPGRSIVHRWSKRLSASDVNKNEQNERNLISLGVGGREGTTARVMQDINDIRDRMMSDEDWQPIRISGEDAETVTLQIEVRLPDQPMHIHQLQVVHAPHRGSGQHNYHTSIRWDADLAQRLRSAAGNGYVGHWATLDRFDSDEYALTITADRPNPRTMGMGV
ncbi:MAG TPA: hypothetical protein PKG77_21115 [Phycisphaerae bacterium]|nr:hypothetical protein [Phycisphaerae bacterium]HQL76230.1 hypothetical protein [Phycisphaerae bacterium]